MPLRLQPPELTSDYPRESTDSARSQTRLHRLMDWKLVRKIARDVVRVERIDYGRCDVLTLAHDNDRHLLVDDKYYSPLVDTLEDRLRARGVRCLSIARIISSIKGDIAYGDVRSPEGAFARALIGKRVKGAARRGVYPFSVMEERIWEKILETTGAKRVIGIQPSRELCRAARRRGVWVADLQHGVIAESHPWYGSRFREREPSEFLPHAFVVWDPGSAEVLEWARASGSDVIVVGNPWISRFITPHPEDSLVRRLVEAAGGSFARNGKKNVLVSLSWGDTDIPNGVMTDELATAIRASQNEYNWFLRLHPNQLRGFASHEAAWFHKYYAEHLDGLATWKDATRQPLPLVLSQMDMHVTWNSSVCIEAAHFGLSSALLNHRMHSGGDKSDYYCYYKAVGRIDEVANTPESILDWLKERGESAARFDDYTSYDQSFEQLVMFLSDEK